MTKNQCPLGEDCDLTLAWMKGAEDARDRAKARIEALEAKLAKAVKDLKGWLEVSQHCTIEDGVCCCGEDMKGHANPMSCGHSPADYGAYAAKRLEESTRATLSEIEGEKG
jgi:hypothetical protein